MAVLLSGGFVAHIGPFRFSNNTIWRPLGIAAVLLAIRHFFWRAHPIHQRVALWEARRRGEPDMAAAVLAGFSRLAVLFVGYAAVLTIGLAQERIGFQVSHDPLTNLPARFDAGWYGDIALTGYRFSGRYDLQTNIAFFPAYPAVLRVGGDVAGALTPGFSHERRLARTLWAGTVISILAFALGVVYFRRLAAEWIGPERANAAVALLAAYPFAVFFSAAYTESLFLLGTAAAFYYFRRRAWIWAAAWGLLVGAMRPNGCLLSAVLACVLVEQWRAARRGTGTAPDLRGLLAAAAPGVGMLAYSAYIGSLTGNWFAWARVQQAWGRSVEGLPPAADLLEAFRGGTLVPTLEKHPSVFFDAMALVFVLAMLWPAFRYLGLAAGSFIAINLLPAVMGGTVLSMGRFSSTLFPIFIALAAILPRPLVLPFAIAFAVGQGLIAVLFFTWRPPF